MLKLNSELRAQAREALRGKWPMAAVAAQKPEISEEALQAMNGFMNGIGFDDSYLAELGK